MARRASILLYLWMTCITTQSAYAQQAEIRVSLFGQPCQLSGPLTPSQLKDIHWISPEQIPAAPTPEQIKEGLGRVSKKRLSLPPSLDRYRERLEKRLNAQSDFFKAMEQSKKSGKTAPLIDVSRNHAYSRQQKILEDLINRIAKKKPIRSWEPLMAEAVRDAYNDAIEPHPEEEFHRAIKHMGVKYTCMFEESED